MLTARLPNKIFRHDIIAVKITITKLWLSWSSWQKHYKIALH